VTIVYLVVIDGVGRRLLLMLGAATMMLSVFILAILIRILFPDNSHIASSCSAFDSPFPLHSSSANSTVTESRLFTTTTLSQDALVTGIVSVPSSSSIPSPHSDYRLTSPATTWVALIAVFFYVAGYSIGFGPGTHSTVYMGVHKVRHTRGEGRGSEKVRQFVTEGGGEG